MTTKAERITAMKRVNELCNTWRYLKKKEICQLIYAIGRHYLGDWEIDWLVKEDKTGILKEIKPKKKAKV